MPISVTFPFALATGSLGYLEPTNDIVSAIESNVRSLLLTNKGERVMHASFGCNLREFLFEMPSSSLQAAISNRIKSQISTWLPYLNVAGVRVTLSSDDKSIPDPGFKISLDLTYGNIPINLFLIFPST